MPLIQKILFPVDFSESSIAMAAYVKRAAAVIQNAKVSLLHVVDPASYNGFELYLRRPQEIAIDHIAAGRELLDGFLTAEFPLDRHTRIVEAGDPATRISQVATEGGFDLIIMPTHAGVFRRMLLGSTTAKVLNDCDIPVLTSHHAQTIAPRPIEHREWLCAVGLGPDSERVLRFAGQAAAEVHSHLVLLHAIQSTAADLPLQLDLREMIRRLEREQAERRIAELEHNLGIEAPVRIAIGGIKDALLEATRARDADVLIIGRNPRSGLLGRMRDLTYAIVRDSPFPVLSV